MGSLEGKVALITGAARGQGEAEARLFAAEGAHVVISDVRDDTGEALAAAIGDAAVYRHLDVTDERNWDAVIAFIGERFGHVDVLVNNAGVYHRCMIEDLSLDEYVRVIGINQVGVWLGMKKTFPLLRDAGGGAIVNISSIAGFQGAAGGTAYASSKWAVRGMTKCAALEFAPFGIRVNSVHPGAVATDMLARSDGQDPRELFATLVPLGRVAEGYDIARVVLFLASEAGSYCTGTELVVDGGMLSGARGPAVTQIQKGGSHIDE